MQDKDLNTACRDLANEFLAYIEASIGEHPAFKNFVSESITDTCNTSASFSNRFDYIANSEKGTCTIVMDRLSNMRLVNGDEMSVNDYIEQKVDEFNPSTDEFTRDYNNANDMVIEKYCDNGGSKSSKSTSTTNGAKSGKGDDGRSKTKADNGVGAKSGKDSKSSQAVLKKRKRMREPKSKKD